MNLTSNQLTSVPIEAKILALENLLYPKCEFWQNEILDLHLQNKIPSSWLQDDFLMSFEQLQNFDSTGLLHQDHPWFALSQSLSSACELPSLYSQHASQTYNYFAKEIKAKKIYEINQLLSFTEKYSTLEQDARLIDLAGGKGHLSAAYQKTHPKLNFKRTVIDTNLAFCHEGFNDNSNQFQSVDLLKTKTFNIHQQDHLFLLHGCGELSDRTIEQHLTHQCHSLHLVGCCYHLIKKPITFQNYDLQLSLQALHLATKTYRQFALRSWQKLLNQKHYRYSLAIWFQQKFLKPMPALRSSPSTLYQADFLTYAKEQLKRLNISENQKILQELETCYSDHFDQIEKLIKLGVLRLLFARPIEIYIALKRAQTLSRNGHHKIQMGEIFQRKISPRNILLFAKN